MSKRQPTPTNRTQFIVYRLAIALLTVIAAMPLALILAFFSAPTIRRVFFVNAEIEPLALMIIVFAVCWVGFMVVLTLAGRFMAFLIVLSLPLAHLFSGYPLTQPQWIIVLVSFIVFIAFSRLIHRTATPILAILTVWLAFGLYLFPPFRSMFTARNTATIAWLINVLLCWTLLSVAIGLIENAVISRRPSVEAKTPQADPIQDALKVRMQKIQRTAALEKLAANPENRDTK